MNDDPVDLDKHRGMAAQQETDARRERQGDVRDADAAESVRRQEMERFLSLPPATDWIEAADRAAFLLRGFAATAEGQDPRLKTLIARSLQELGDLTNRDGEKP